VDHANKRRDESSERASYCALGGARLRLLFYLATCPGGKKSLTSKNAYIHPPIHIHQQKKKNQKENLYDDDYALISTSSTNIQGGGGI
jgi:hypothetical protein